MFANFSVTRYSSPALAEPVDLRRELEALEDVAHRRRERLDVGAQVLADVVLVAHQLLQVERRRVVEVLPGLLEQERLGVEPAFLRSASRRARPPWSARARSRGGAAR
jgi:hypothetical protein